MIIILNICDEMMNDRKDILEQLQAGKLTIKEAEELLKKMSLEQIDRLAVIDYERAERTGIPEVIIASTKENAQLEQIIEAMVERKGIALLTRTLDSQLEYLMDNLEDVEFEIWKSKDHNTVLITSMNRESPDKNGLIAIVTAGTSDIAYANEVEGVAKFMGVEYISYYDIGIAGMHRLIEPLQEIREKDVDAIVVLAGMEGALPTLIASLVDIPVIGVPIPTGYGYGGNGETALASMLQSCAPGLSVMNIGNGFGAGAFACLIAQRRKR